MPLLGSRSFTTALTDVLSDPVTGLGPINACSLVTAFTATSGGTSCTAVVQTSFDGGVTWFDICRFDFTTSSEVKRANVDGDAQIGPTALATLSSESVIHGLFGDRLRLSVTTAGTFGAGSKVEVFYQVR
jgi:hypothetical protein